MNRRSFFGAIAALGVAAVSGGASAKSSKPKRVDISRKGGTFTREQVRELVDEINKAQRDGYVLDREHS